MNLAQINLVRQSLGLAAVSVNPVKAAKKKNHEKNLAMRAQASRELKYKRTGKGK